MKNTLKNTYLGILLLLALFGGCSKCKKDIDPCIGYKPFSADFTIGENISYGRNSKFVETDTIFEGQLVTFEAKQEMDSYEWKVGADPRVWTTKKFSLSFFGYLNNDIFEPTTVSITLRAKRAKKEIDNTCNPSTKEEETMTRKIVIIPYSLRDLNTGKPFTQSPIVGSYEGTLLSAPSDKFMVDIKYKYDQQTGDEYYYFTNLNKGCNPLYTRETDKYWSRLETHYTAAVYDDCCILANGCNRLQELIFFLNPTKDSITAYYKAGLNPQTDYVFKGKRIR